MPKHRELRRIPFTAEQMFDLVADVRRYPEFLPYCARLDVQSEAEGGRVVVATLEAHYHAIREKFTSRVALDRAARRIDVQYVSGPFRELHNHWRFEPADGGCIVHFEILFHFKNPMLDFLSIAVFHQIVHKMIVAFEQRAAEIYNR